MAIESGPATPKAQTKKKKKMLAFGGGLAHPKAQKKKKKKNCCPARVADHPGRTTPKGHGVASHP
jgi:hypothetical protein